MELAECVRVGLGRGVLGVWCTVFDVGCSVCESKRCVIRHVCYGSRRAMCIVVCALF